SIHSGSDKFSIYNSISQITNQRFHLKTAGTNWLEALRLIAKVKPDLYEEIFNYSYNHFNETQKFYHITPNLNNITPLQNIEYKDYYTHLNNDNVRQLLHVSFGILLTAKDNKGNFLFKNRLQTIWNEHEEDYHEIIRKHINKHLKLLNLIK
ncbi:tagaturonate epimerase family protein, partial [Staphylococcus gallinarum]